MKTLRNITLLLTVLLTLLLLAACSGGEAQPETTQNNASTATAAQSGMPDPKQTLPEAASQTESPAGSGAYDPKSYLDVSGVDFSQPEYVIQADDFDGMNELARKMQNFELPADTVVEIFGEVGASMMSHTIVVPNEAGDQRVGTTYEFTGEKEPEVPIDGNPIHIVGVVRMNENYVNVIVVPTERFEVLIR